MLSPLLMLPIGRQLFLVTRRPLCLIPIIALQLDTTWAWLLREDHQTVKDAKRRINSILILIIISHAPDTRDKKLLVDHNMLVHVVYPYNNYTGGTGVKEP